MVPASTGRRASVCRSACDDLETSKVDARLSVYTACCATLGALPGRSCCSSVALSMVATRAGSANGRLGIGEWLSNSTLPNHAVPIAIYIRVADCATLSAARSCLALLWTLDERGRAVVFFLSLTSNLRTAEHHLHRPATGSSRGHRPSAEARRWTLAHSEAPRDAPLVIISQRAARSYFR